MPTLSIRKDQLTIQAGWNQTAVLTQIAQEFLPAAGYTNTKFEGHIFAAKNGCLVDVFLLAIGGLLSWQVILCVGPSQAVCDTVRDEVFRISAGHLQEIAI